MLITKFTPVKIMNVFSTVNRQQGWFGTFIETQNGWGWKEPLELIWSNPLAQSGLLVICAEPCLESFWISARWETSSLNNLWQCSFPDILKETSVFRFVPVAFDPVTRHHLQVWLCHVCTLPGDIYIYRWEPNWDFSRLKSPSFSSCISCSRPFRIFVAIHCTLFTMSMCFWLQGAQDWTQYSSCGHISV